MSNSVRPVPFGHPGHAPAPVTTRVEDVALVFEGGGMRGVYTAALVQVLLEAGLHFPWVGGISAGSTNTVNMVTRDLWRTREAFVRLTTDPLAGGWGSFARGQGYFNSEHIYQHTSAPEESIPFDWPAFEAATRPAGAPATRPAAPAGYPGGLQPAQPTTQGDGAGRTPAAASSLPADLAAAMSGVTVRIGSFRCDTGEEVYWGAPDMPDLAALQVRCQASSSMPVLMPEVEVDGVAYLDGAIGPTGGFATDAAAADGYERMLVVCTRPVGYRKPAERHPAVYRRLFRRWPAVAEGIIHRPENYNRTLDELADGVAAGRVYLYQPTQMPIVNGELRYDRVVSAYEAGLVQARAELGEILAFMGV